MEKEVKLVKIIKRLLRRLGCPRFLHRFGPKKYELYVYLACLLTRHYCRLSYRRLKKILGLLGLTCPSKSALQYNAARFPSWLWNKALEITSGSNHYLVALDGTGFARTNPSYYYLRRIDGKMPGIGIKLNAAFDTANKKWPAAKVRILPRHDVKDAEYLLDNSRPRKLVADKAYDANKLHEYCKLHRIQAHIPMRDYGKSKHHSLSCRRKAARHFSLRTYHRRELIESGFSSLKRKYGASVSSKTAKAIRADVYGRLLCHNLFGYCLGFRTLPILQ